MATIRIGAWETLPSEGGDRVAIDGDRMAVSGIARLCVWHGRTRLATVDSPVPAPGAPRFFGSRVYWGPGFYDLESGAYRWLESAAPPARPAQTERCQVYAWAPHGDWLLGSFSTGHSTDRVRVTLFNGHNGEKVADLWRGGGLPPQAAWIGKHLAVVGFNNPQVYSLSGEHLADIEINGATIATLEATMGERRLIAVDQAQTIYWIDTANWAVLDQWPGPWLWGAVSPDGQVAVALEPWGKLHLAFLEGDRFNVVGHAVADSNAIALALASSQVASVGGGEVRRASLSVD